MTTGNSAKSTCLAALTGGSGRRSIGALAIALVVLLAAPTGTVAAAETPTFLLGDQTIVLPEPTGFKLVTESDRELQQIFESFATPGEIRISLYVPDSWCDMESLGDCTLDRYVILNSFDPFRSYRMPKREFEGVKEEARDIATLSTKEMTTELNELMNEKREDISKATGMNPAFKFEEPHLFRPHSEGDHYIAFSGLSSYAYVDAYDRRRSRVVTQTTVIYYLYGKLIQLNIYGDEEDLYWTRESAEYFVSLLDSLNLK